jgi:hypothetical protein
VIHSAGYFSDEEYTSLDSDNKELLRMLALAQQQMVKESLTRAFDELHSGKVHHNARDLFKK